MPTKVNQIVRVKLLAKDKEESKEIEGVPLLMSEKIATVVTESEDVYTGAILSVKLHVVMTCDNVNCSEGKIDPLTLQLCPKVIDYIDNGVEADFPIEASSIFHTNWVKHKPMAFCCGACATAYIRRTGKYTNLIIMPDPEGRAA